MSEIKLYTKPFCEYNFYYSSGNSFDKLYLFINIYLKSH
jgi:hypothetical protein